MRLIAPLLLLLSLTLHAQLPPKADFYTVQVGTFANVTSADFDDLAKESFVYAEAAPDDFKRVFIGRYETETEAEQLLEKVRKQGFKDAFVSSRYLSRGEPQTYIQIASIDFRKPVNWSRHRKAGKLHALPDDKYVRLLVGPYSEKKFALAALPSIRSMGYKDAFVKESNSVAAHRLTDFNTGIKEVESTSEAPEVLTDKGKNSTQPVVTIPKINGNISQPTTLVAMQPTAASKKRRTSVYQLQKMLKSLKAYDGKLDGIYGSGTSNGIATFETNSSMYNQYRILADNLEALAPVPNAALQKPINTVADDPIGARVALEKNGSPIAKAYLAYALHTASTDPTRLIQVNRLMNDAVTRTFEGVEDAPFDYTATYSYDKIDQLILHLGYLHRFTEEQVSAPCWLFVRHPEATIAAFETESTFSGNAYAVQDCGAFSNWDNVQLLRAAALTLDPKSAGMKTKDDREKARILANRRTRLFLVPRKLSDKEQQQSNDWYTMLFTNLDERAGRDQLFKKLYQPLKFSFHTVWIDLEDYYLNRGFEQQDANALALYTLYTLTGEHLDGYID